MLRTCFKNATIATAVPCLIVALAAGTANAQQAEVRSTINDLKAGQTIAIAGLYLPGKTIIAAEVEAENIPPSRTRAMVGNIESVNPETNSLVVSGMKVVVTPDTFIELDKVEHPVTEEVLEPARPIKLSELQPGWTLEAEGVMDESGALIAVELQAEKARAAEVELEGELENVDAGANQLTVMGYKIIVNNRTIIEVE